jgi:alpha-methylacyl-CoA racemase
MQPLTGIRIVELAAIGPTPFCGMMLADHGAEVLYVHRPGAAPDPRDPLLRGRVPVEADLKSSGGVAHVRALAASADGLIEGFRPGVMERLGLGPAELHALNPRLVYGRMTGWGQTGPLAGAAGHDINYIALAGALHAFGRAGDKPTPPVNAVGDFGGGGMLLAFAVAAGLLQARTGGRGTVIDCAMSEGAALLMSMVWGFRETLGWRDARGVNILDGGAHFYESYETADGKYVAIGAIEPQFYARLRAATGLADDPDFDAQMNPAAWPMLRDKLAAIFRTRTRDAWCALLEGTDACFAPVLSMAEAPGHPHNVARGAFIERAGVVQPAPAPRFSAPQDSTSATTSKS